MRICTFLTCLFYSCKSLALPTGFAYLTDPRFILSMDYHGDQNFIGCQIDGYNKKLCVLSKPAIAALKAVQDELDSCNKGYVLKIFDAYRPQRAVEHFVRWSADPNDTKMKDMYYPDLSKPDIIRLGYVFPKSSHSRGSTVDLTIVEIDPNNPAEHKELEMGTRFDFFGEASHTDSQLVSKTAQENRQFFKALMAKYGFENYPQEWWHFTLKPEPFPDTYFDFAIN